jgi:hypothetical protein
MQVDIRITETLSRVITIDSLSIEDAIITVENMYKNEEIVLDYSNFNDDVLIEKKEENINSKKDLLINDVIQYLIKNEKKHYEESDKPSKHIYLTLLELQNYL